MYAAGPRVERKFLDRVSKLDDRSESMAEIYRRSRGVAEQMGIPRPSYERIRLHIHASRKRREELKRVGTLLLELGLNTRRAEAVLADLLDYIE